MREMLGEQQFAANVDTRASDQRMLRERVFDLSNYNPIIGMINEIGSPNNAIGIMTGNRKTSNGSL